MAERPLDSIRRSDVMVANEKIKPKVVMYACSGACNLGQIANEAVRTLDQLGQGTMGSSVAVAARNPKEVAFASQAGQRVIVDGCGDSCLMKVFRSAGLSVDKHVIVDALGVETKHEFEYSEEQVAVVACTITEAIHENEKSGSGQYKEAA